MKIGFLSNKLTMRGTEMTIYTYAHYNETILGNTSIIITRPFEHVMQVSPRDVTREAYDHFASRFQIEYYINPSDVDNIVRRHGLDVLFIEKAGSPTDGLVFHSCKTLIHAVFTTKEPHGDLYLPISDALNTICGTNYPVLPYCIRVDTTEETLHEELGIPRDAIVFGSYCGADEYTVEYVREAVRQVGTDSRYSNIYFIFLNVIPFCNQSERIRFLPGTVDMKRKRMFINTCNAMLYGRAGGETFGLACGEFSVCNKPVIARPGEHSNAHEVILGKDMIRHTSYEHVYDILTHWDHYVKDVSNNGYKKFIPEPCMEIFQQYLWQLVPPHAPVSHEI
jgi:hypothetical protein